MLFKVTMDKCDSNLEELRDKDGFIDLTNFKFKEKSKELRGNQKRIKNWVKFKDCEGLVKGEFYFDKPNNGVYAEVISSFMARHFNLEAACYSLVKLKDEDGKIIKGVFSKNMITKNEELISLHELIGLDNGEFIDATDYYFVMDNLPLALEKRGFTKDKINKVMIDLKKQLAFSLLVLDTDNHIENISFIIKNKDIRISPLYDKEASLLLDNDEELTNKLLEDISLLEDTVNIAQPRIGTIKPEIEGGLESYWQDTLEALIVDDEIYDFCFNILGHKLDMDSVFKEIENRFEMVIPENVKLLSKYAYLSRYKIFRKIVLGTI